MFHVHISQGAKAVHDDHCFASKKNEYATNDKSECICIIDQWALLIDKIYVTIYYLLGGNAIETVT